MIISSKNQRDVNILCEFLNFNNTWENDMGPRFLEYRKKWAEVTRKHIVTRFPMHLDFDLTNACTLACTFCPRTQLIRRGQYPGTYYMPFKIFKKSLLEGSQKGLMSVNLNASGEPLLHKDLTRMVKLAREHGILDIMLHTSAVYLTKDLMASLIENGLTKLIISFDSPVKEHYEQLRVNASYDTVVKNINQAVEIKNKCGSVNPFIRINMVLMKENFNERDQMIKMWSHKVDGIGFLEYINYFQWDETDRYIHTMKYKEDFICEKPWQRLGIAHDGMIKFCHLDDMNEVTLGSLDETTIEEAWKDETMRLYRKLHLSGRIKYIALCSKCSVPMLPAV